MVSLGLAKAKTVLYMKLTLLLIFSNLGSSCRKKTNKQTSNPPKQIENQKVKSTHTVGTSRNVELNLVVLLL